MEEGRDDEKQKKKGRINWESVDPRTLIQEEFPLAVKKLLALKVSNRPPVPIVSVISATPLEVSLEPRLLIQKENISSLYISQESRDNVGERHKKQGVKYHIGSIM